MMLEAINLHCWRDENKIFGSLAFKLEPGTLLFIKGPNGCGKTTLLKILAGLKAPSEGNVLWKGNDIAKSQNRSVYLQDMAYLGHEPGVPSGLTCEEYFRVWGYTKGDSTPIHTLSRGQKQRLALTRVLLKKASLWLLDEPFSALDQEGQFWLEDCLYRHCRERGIAVVVSHQLENLKGTCSQILHLDNHCE